MHIHLRSKNKANCMGIWFEETPHVQVVPPADQHFLGWAELLRGIGSAGNLTTDTHLAALAIERKRTLCSTDVDFERFPGLRWVTSSPEPYTSCFEGMQVSSHP